MPSACSVFPPPFSSPSCYHPAGHFFLHIFSARGILGSCCRPPTAITSRDTFPSILSTSSSCLFCFFSFSPLPFSPSSYLPTPIDTPEIVVRWPVNFHSESRTCCAVSASPEPTAFPSLWPQTSPRLRLVTGRPRQRPRRRQPAATRAAQLA